LWSHIRRRTRGDPGDRGGLPALRRQRCLAHRMRNLAAKVPTDLWPEFKARATACYQVPSRAFARDLAAGLVAECPRLRREGGAQADVRRAHPPPSAGAACVC
jgi:hypothetical protein